MKPQYRCLGARVLVAAKITYPPNYWKAFILPVPGRNFDEEVAEVFAGGSALDHDLACFLFPDYAALPYDR